MAEDLLLDAAHRGDAEAVAAHVVHGYFGRSLAVVGQLLGEIPLDADIMLFAVQSGEHRLYKADGRGQAVEVIGQEGRGERKLHADNFVFVNSGGGAGSDDDVFGLKGGRLPHAHEA